MEEVKSAARELHPSCLWAGISGLVNLHSVLELPYAVLTQRHTAEPGKVPVLLRAVPGSCCLSQGLSAGGSHTNAPCAKLLVSLLTSARSLWA